MEETSKEDLKKMAAEEAVKEVGGGMVVGLGTGSTVKYAILKLGELGLDIRGVPTSKATERLARENGIQLIGPDECERIDVDIDGADEVDPRLNLIKGGGGALTREKIVAALSNKVIIVADESKKVPFLGNFPVAVEVLEFNLKAVKRTIEKMGAQVSQRMSGSGVFRTDEGNIILDAKFEKIDDAEKMEMRLNNIPGVLENGIFPKRYVNKVILAGRKGVHEI